MAVNVSVYDLVNYPDNSKTVTVDIKQVTPIGYEGDEQWVISCVTSAYSCNTDRTSIQDIYIQNQKAGWAKSSGLLNYSIFTIDSTNNKFQLKIDSDPTWREITLASGINIPGDVITDDMETKIRALGTSEDPCDLTTYPITVGTTYALAYKNASVEFANSKFKIISGTVAEEYTGVNRSSVVVRSSAGYPNPAAAYLGFDLGVDTYVLAGQEVKEVLLAQNYPGGSVLDVDSGFTTVSGMVFYIEDETNSEYFLCVGGTTTALSIYTAAAGAELVNTYTAGEAKVQKVVWVDPDYEPNGPYSEVDDIVRWGIKSQANQIDYSS